MGTQWHVMDWRAPVGAILQPGRDNSTMARGQALG